MGINHNHLHHLYQNLLKMRRPPRLTPIKGQVRVGLIITAAYVGGAERWVADLVEATSDKLHWVGVGVARGIFGGVFQKIVPTKLWLGEQACQELGASVDVLLVWTIKHPLSYAARGVPIIAVSHSPAASPWARDFFSEDGVIGADHYVGVSESAVGCLPEQFQDAAKVIGHAVNPRRLEAVVDRRTQREYWGVHPEAIVMGYIGRLSAEKRYNLVWQALNHLPEHYSAVLVGDGPHVIEEKAASDYLGARCRFVGPVTDVGSAIHAMDMLVIPSEYESFCYVMLEGWTTRTPVVCTRTGVAVHHPEFCYLLPDNPTPRSVARLARKTQDWTTVVRAVEAVDIYSWKRFGDEWSEYIWEVHEQQCARLYAGNHGIHSKS